MADFVLQGSLIMSGNTWLSHERAVLTAFGDVAEHSTAPRVPAPHDKESSNPKSLDCPR